jgi:antitoxin component YwqK of YwqJK toxin-antitoxin module
MIRSDSASVKSFKADTFFFNGERYTGAVANYDANENLIIEGYIKNGLMDSTWKFYYASGAVMMEGRYKDGIDVGLWHSYYGKDRPKVVKLYDDLGYALMRVEYYDNGHIKNYQNVKAPMFGNKERTYTNDQHGEMISIYVEDSVLVLKQGQTTERVGKNIFVLSGKSGMDIAK